MQEIVRNTKNVEHCLIDRKDFSRCADRLFDEHTIGLVCRRMSKDSSRIYLHHNIRCAAKFRVYGDRMDCDYLMISSAASLVDFLLSLPRDIRTLMVKFNIDCKDGFGYNAPEELQEQIELFRGVRVYQEVRFRVSFFDNGKFDGTLPKNMSQHEVYTYLESLKEFMLQPNPYGKDTTVTTSPFLRLPREVRDKIYRLILKSDPNIRLIPSHFILERHRCDYSCKFNRNPCRQKELEAGKLLDTKVLRTNKQVFAEARSVLYGENIFSRSDSRKTSLRLKNALSVSDPLQTASRLELKMKPFHDALLIRFANFLLSHHGLKSMALELGP